MEKIKNEMKKQIKHIIHENKRKDNNLWNV